MRGEDWLLLAIVIVNVVIVVVMCGVALIEDRL